MLSAMDGWDLFGERIEAERKTRRWTYRDIQKRSSIATTTWKNWAAGKVPRNHVRLRVVCDLFEWTYESIDIIRAGGDPVPRDPAIELPGDVLDQMDLLATAIEDSAASIRRMLSQVVRSKP